MENNAGNLHTPSRTRPREQDERVDIIFRRIYEASYEGKKVNSADLAAECEVDERTIYDDRQYMDRMDMPSKWFPKEKTLKFTKAVKRNAKALVNEGIVFTLMVTEKALRECQSLKRRRMLLKILKEMASQYKHLVTFDFDSMDDHITVGTMLQPKFDPERVEYLCRCVAMRTEMRVHYDTPKKGKKWRRIWPLHVHKADRDWILFVWDFDRNGIIRLAMGRMLEIKETGETFERPPFNIDKELEGALIIYTGEEIMEVGLMFTPEVAHIIRENRVNCESAREHFPDGSLKLNLRLGSLVEIPILIGPYGADAYPLYPPQAVENYICSARAMLKAVGATA
ncbi:MAG: transcriptional regulator-like protein [Verrucomicrobiales bacterium]|nr:transcriptional regulator-like protein [Verrucomicrobiales bacterium]